MEGKNIGNYWILKKIGEGGMGSVYLAHDLSLEREVALKIISPELARNPHLMTRFRVEAIAQARLNHANIVTIHSFDQQEDIYYIVMEYVSGTTLKNFIKEKGKIPVIQALQIAAGILEGLAYAHDRGVLHRDIKPANIFITPAQDVKLGDFGIAKVEGIDGLTRVGSTLGTLLYSSPEQLRGQKMDAATDIYSLGATLYEMIVGTPPFTSPTNSNYEIQLGHLEKIPAKPSSINSKIPPEVDALLLKSLAKPPASRYSSAVEFKRAVVHILTGDPREKPMAGKLKGGKINPLAGLNVPKFKLPPLKLPALDTSLFKKLIRKIRGFKESLPSPRIASGSKTLDKRQLVIILISLLIFLFIVIIAFADNLGELYMRHPPKEHLQNTSQFAARWNRAVQRAEKNLNKPFKKMTPAALPEPTKNEHSLKK